MYEAFLIHTRSSKLVKKFRAPGPSGKMFKFTILKMQNLGCRAVEIRNTIWEGDLGMVFYGPAFPLSIVVVGAQLTDEDGKFLSEEDSKMELDALGPYLEE